MKKKLVALLAMMVMSMSIMTACGDSSNSSDTEAEETAITANQVQSAITNLMMDPEFVTSAPAAIDDVEIPTALADYPTFSKGLEAILGGPVSSLEGFYLTINDNSVTVVEK